MKELDMTRKLIAHEEDQDPYEIDGFKKVHPDGVTLFVGQKAITLSAADVTIIQE